LFPIFNELAIQNTTTKAFVYFVIFIKRYLDV